MHTIRNNGFNVDGDLLFTTNNEIFLKNIKDTKSVVCVQNSGQKKIPSISDFHESNKSGFSNKIGSITNKGATMADIKSIYDEHSEEYRILDRRIRHIQLYQQMEIDSLKGIEVSQMPKRWYDKYVFDYNKETGNYEKHDLFDMSILADRKPYFMIYIYDDLMKKYKKYINKQESSCANQFLKSLEELIDSPTRTKKEHEFLSNYYRHFPVSNHDGTMNRICRYMECQLENIKLDNETFGVFNASHLKSDLEYEPDLFVKMKKKYSEYNESITKKVRELKMNISLSYKDRKREKSNYIKLQNDKFRKDCLDICGDMETLSNVLIDVCYTSNKSKQFAWDICGEQIIENLLNNNDRVIKYIERDKNGAHEYLGQRFSICEMEV